MSEKKRKPSSRICPSCFCFETRCDYCKKMLTEPGALMFSPPQANGIVNKFHICKPCWYSEVVKP